MKEVKNESRVNEDKDERKREKEKNEGKNIKEGYKLHET